MCFIWKIYDSGMKNPLVLDTHYSLSILLLKFLKSLVFRLYWPLNWFVNSRTWSSDVVFSLFFVKQRNKVETLCMSGYSFIIFTLFFVFFLFFLYFFLFLFHRIIIDWWQWSTSKFIETGKFYLFLDHLESFYVHKSCYCFVIL